MSEARRTRKRKILIETLGNIEPSLNIKKERQGHLFYNQRFLELHKKNRFIVHLEKDCENEPYSFIDETRISSFKFSIDGEGNKIIVIESILQLEEWVEEFLDVNMCKLYILNTAGEIVKSFDYDIVNSGYEYELRYDDDSLLSPKFFYRIF